MEVKSVCVSLEKFNIKMQRYEDTRSTRFTAAHSVCNEELKLLDKSVIDSIRVVFGFHITSTLAKKKFNESDVYRIKDIVQYN